MKLIIAGGRHYTGSEADFELVHKICYKYKVTEIVSGGAMGADLFGERCAGRLCLPIKRFPADWKTHGKAAGPIRNAEMADYADAVLLFPGGKGTANMEECALKRNLLVLHSYKKV